MSSQAQRKSRPEIAPASIRASAEIAQDRVGGIAVHIGARVAAKAEAGELLVSSTVKDLVAGSGLRFTDRGTHVLKGVPDKWRLFAVSR
jgi:class 3 adenylate cyclase